MRVTISSLQDVPPQGAVVTEYDRRHMTQYMRLLDAAGEGASWQEAAQIILGLDAQKEPERVRLVHDAHLERARWLSSEGYRQLAAGRTG
ncbi:DNA -binding domain-containing protein [Celeribacter baekdonensis]|uniref:T6SS Transcription factor RovC-like DNA binding domain-containing protein n=1 Tax=Celeribacter baekdonensis B30 TaxID=1208323 RepID=K2IDY3_9RHOB|nr:DUF2285 domain-containing protein [Celeribacter baekdonensis]EKE68171.1 hypothetical protein B30_18727 [Celeribacter baekdonensis B30]